MIFASIDPLNFNEDPEPFERNGVRATWRDAHPDFEPGPFGKIIESSKWTYAPRAEFNPKTTHPFNPILTAFRYAVSEYYYDNGSDYGVELVQEWIDALEDPESGTAEIIEAIIEALGNPAGPGFEDDHYAWAWRANGHARSVLRRLKRFLEAN